MMKLPYPITKIAKIIKAEAFITNVNAEILQLVIDTRTFIESDTSLFFALVAQRDGHRFVNEAYQQGIRNFVVSKTIDYSKYKGANFLKVDDTLMALQDLATYNRKEFDLEVIGITGSNGKTIVKEWLYQLLGNDYNIVKNPKSYNSQIGAALSVWEIGAANDLGIFEAGISKPNEMQLLATIIKPTIGILTNLGEAHQEGFSDKKEKLMEKLKLFKDVELLIYSPDYVLDVALDQLPGKKQFTWSFTQPADLQVIKVADKNQHSCLTALYKKQQIYVEIPFTGKASTENAVICWAAMLALNYSQVDIEERFKKISPIGMRLQLLNGIESCSIIDDSYSADISSLVIALDFLKQQNQNTKKTLILSDIFESGKPDEVLYPAIAKLLKKAKIDRLIGIGGKLSEFERFFTMEASFYPTTEAFVADFKTTDFFRETILVKGARKFEFEKIIKLLAQKIHDTILEVNLNALTYNLNYYRAKLKPNVKVMAMVKAFSYGSGSFEIANTLQYNKVDYLAVAYADEGIALRKAGITLPIMVMSPEPFAFAAMVKYQLEPEIYNIEVLNQFLHFLTDDVFECPIHIKLDTGMHRLGFEPDEIQAMLSVLQSEKKLKVVSIFSHLVGADSEQHDDFTTHQIELFNKMYQQIVAALGYQPLAHIANTSGISRWPTAQMDMVRLGIGMYGFDSALPTGVLQTVATLKTTITQLKDLPPGETVGYSRKGILNSGGKIATVKIGYADGYSRAFGNGVGEMLVGGKLVPTIGAICMDMTMIDVTGLDVAVGEEVIVFNHQHTIVALAKQINTIPYEILTNISQRVKRVYFYE